MTRTCLTFMTFLAAFPAAAAAQSGGMALPESAGGGAAAPAPTAPVAEPAPPVAVAPVPPADIGPRGPNHDVAPAAPATEVAADAAQRATPAAGAHVWPRAEAQAASGPAPQAPRLIGAAGPGSMTDATAGGSMSRWLMAAFGGALALALISALLTRRGASRPTRASARAQGLHRFA